MLNVNSQLVGTYFHDYRLTVEFTAHTASNILLGESVSSPKRFVVVKFFQATSLDSRQQELFSQELRQLRQLRHPHILPLLDFGIDKERPYIISEYAANGSLEDRIRRQFPLPLPIDDALTITSQIGQALHYAHHRKIVHGNLKPQNILFNAKGNALLADFHLVSMGTLDNKESLPAAATNTPLDDQYALASIAYEMLTGRKPFASLLEDTTQEAGSVLPPTQLNPSLPIDVEYALVKALDPDPQQRYSHAYEFIKAIDARTASPAAIDSTPAPVVPEQNTVATAASEQDIDAIVMADTVAMGAVAIPEVSDVVSSPEQVPFPAAPSDASLMVLPSLAVSSDAGHNDSVEASPLQQLPFPDHFETPLETPLASGVGISNTAKKGPSRLQWVLIIACALLLVGSFSGLFYMVRSQHTPQNNPAVHATVSTTSTPFVGTASTPTVNALATPTVGGTATASTQILVASATASTGNATPTTNSTAKASTAPTATHAVTPTATPKPKATATPSPTPTATPTSVSASQEVACSVSYTVANDRGISFSAMITIGNTGNAPLTHWALSWSFSGTQVITSGWGGSFSQSGRRVTVTGTQTIAPGTTLSGIGFNASNFSRNNTAPKSFTVNGVPCS
jgi:cytoskeletal protein RodZ